MEAHNAVMNRIKSMDRMERIDAILQDERVLYGLTRIAELEADRIFCCHRLDHLLDVARIAWIMVLEEQIPLEKDIVYGAALLHDLGRYRQYEENIPHHQASADLARAILPDAGYSSGETAMIAEAIGQHGEEDASRSHLARVLYRADKLSRTCFQCAAQETCKWSAEKRNQSIVY